MRRASSEGYARDSSEYRRTVVALFASAIATFTTLYGPQAVLPAIGADYGINAAAAGLVMSVATGTLALGVIPFAAFSDRWGRTRFIGYALLAASLIGLIEAASPDLSTLLALRAIQGLTLAGLQVAALNYINEEIESRSVGAAVGLYIAGNGLGGMCGRLFAGAINDLTGWRVALASIALVSLAGTATYAWLVLPSRRFVPIQARLSAQARALPAALRDPHLLRLVVTGACAIAYFVAIYNYLGFRLTRPPFAVSSTGVSLIATIYALGAVGSAVSGRLVDLCGHRFPLLIGALAAPIGVCIMLPDRLFAVIIGLVVVTVGFFITHSTASGWVGSHSAAHGLPGSTVYLLIFYLGSSVGGWLGGMAFGQGAWDGLALFSLGLSGLALGIAILISCAWVKPAGRPENE